MPKLHSVGRPSPEELIGREPMHTCRWCHYCVTEDGGESFKCVKGCAVSSVSSRLTQELLNDDRIENIARSVFFMTYREQDNFVYQIIDALYHVAPNLSAKKQEQFESEFNSALKDYQENVLLKSIIEQITTRIGEVLSHYEGTTDEGVEIKDPTAHYCRDFF